MLLTITTTHQPATDLGYLLHKHPNKCQTFWVSVGKAHVFYPEATTERCTAALLLDIDPIELVRGKLSAKDSLLEQYVNYRPYVASSNVQPESRKPLINLAKQFHCFAAAIVFDLPESICHERNKQRPDRQFGSHVVKNHARSLKRSLKNLKREGFRFIYKLSSVEEIEAVEVAIQPMWTNRKHERGAFDILLSMVKLQEK